MSEVSKVVQNILDETFTTYPWDKVVNYVSKVSQELSISILPDYQNMNPPVEWMNNSKFDDRKYIVYSLIEKTITDKPDYFENIKKSLQLIGITYSKSFIDNGIEKLVFLPKEQNSINISVVFENLHFIYHICPKYVTEKIKKNGFVPKAKNDLFKYDPRIHFFFPNTPIQEMQLIRQQLDDNNKSKGNTHEYDLIKVKIPDNISFFKDLDSAFGIYTNENIKPEFIEDIKPLDGITIEQYTNWQLNMIFPNL